MVRRCDEVGRRSRAVRRAGLYVAGCLSWPRVGGVGCGGGGVAGWRWGEALADTGGVREERGQTDGVLGG